MSKHISNDLFVYPTDTVWGVGGNIFSKESYDRLLTLKKIKEDRPYSILFSSLEVLKEYVDLGNRFSDIDLKKIFSLETTLLIEKEKLKVDIPEYLLSDKYVSVRCLEIFEIEQLYALCDGPVITTSLNEHGEAPILEDALALDFCSKVGVDTVLIDRCHTILSGQPSTIIAYDSDPIILREGAYAKELRAIL